MENRELVKLGKFLSLVLRHKPELINLELDSQGWVPIESLLNRCKAHGKYIDLAMLHTIVATNNKKRYLISGDGLRIRAAQGHSIPIELDYEPVAPQETLYHGTAERFLDSIFQQGLQKQKRHHVHLSADLATAAQVGARHGKLVLLRVKAGKMHEAGHQFFHTPNGVWLTDSVPPEYLSRIG